MVSQDVVWFDSDVEFEDAIRAMRPAARRPGVWAALFLIAGIPLVVLGLKARPWAHHSVEPAPMPPPIAAAAPAETPLVPIKVAKPKLRKLAKPARRQQLATQAGRLPRRSWPSWATSGPAIAARPAPHPTLEAPVLAPRQEAPSVAAESVPAYEAVTPAPAPLQELTVREIEPAVQRRAAAADDDASVESVEVEMPSDPTPRAKRGDAWKAVLE